MGVTARLSLTFNAEASLRGFTRFLLGGALAALAGTATADPFFSTLDREVTVRTGISIRQLGAHFHTGAMSTLPANFAAGMNPGLGNVGLFTGGTTPITYDDGIVGGDYGLAFGGSATGDAQVIIDSASQLGPTGRMALAMPVQEVTFQTTNFSGDTASMGSSDPLDRSDETTVAGPYVHFVCPIAENGERFCNAFFGYSQVSGDLSTGWNPFAGATANGTFTTYSYTYDYIGPANSSSSFPYDGTSDGGLVYDAALLIATNSDLTGGVIDPRTSASSSAGTLDVVAMNRVDLAVELHEIPFGFEYGIQQGECYFAFTAGLTLNIIEYGLTERMSWYDTASGHLASADWTSNRGSEFSLGAFAGFNARCPLNEKETIFLIGHLTYRWVDEVSVSTGYSTVEIDASSLEGGIGLSFLLR